MKTIISKRLRNGIAIMVLTGAWVAAVPVEAEVKSQPIHDSVTLSDDTVIERMDIVSGGYNHGSGLYAIGSKYNRQNPMQVNTNGHQLAIRLNEKSGMPQLAGIFLENNIAMNVDTGNNKLLVSVLSQDTKGVNGIKVSAYNRLHIKGNVEIGGIHSEGSSAGGIAFQSGGSEIVIDGSLKINDVRGAEEGKKARSKGIGIYGISLTGTDTKMAVNGTVDISGVKGSSLTTSGEDSEISIGGGSISAAEDSDKSHNYYAVFIEKGTVNINMNNTAPGKNSTKIIGDMYVIGQYGKRVVEYSGGELADWKHAGILNVALMNKDSFWTGVAAYEQYNDDFGSGGNTMHDVGNFKLYLQNGATWTNEAQAHVTRTTLVDKHPVYEGSQVTTLIGGESYDKKGSIYQKDAKPITVMDYSGHTLVYYDHDGDGTTGENYKAGDIKIKTAKNGSVITLRTGTNDVDMSDEAKVAKVLNALAGKIQYLSYVEGDTNLKGKVEIAEGLTSSIISKSGDITFIADADKVKNGRGSYVYVPVVIEDLGGPITKSRTLTGDSKIIVNEKYKNDNKISAVYNGENKIVVDMAGHSLRLEGTSNGSGTLSGIRSSFGSESAKNSIEFIHMKKGNPLTISAIHMNRSEANGIYTDKNSRILVDGDVEIERAYTTGRRANGIANRGPNAELIIKGNVKIFGMGDNEWSVVKAEKDTAGINSQAIANIGNHSKLIIEGIANVKIAGIAINSQGAEAVTRIGGGHILVKEDLEPDSKKGYQLIKGSNGTVFINMNEAGTAAGDKETVLQGHIYTEYKENSSNAIIHIGLSDKNSSWTGVTDYNRTSGQTEGKVHLYVSDGAIWNNRKMVAVRKSFTGSHLTSFTGGVKDHEGFIYQKDEKPITIDDYSGHTVLVYQHDKNSPTTMIGGDTKIISAKEGSFIRMLTDAQGLNIGSQLAKDKNLISATLQALANKLFYTAHTDGHLTGTVGIAEGLTAESISKMIREEGMTFKDNGQGDYVFTPVKDDPDAQKISDFTSPITGEADKDTVYAEANVLKNGIYTFKNLKNSVEVDDTKVKAEKKTEYYPTVSAVMGINRDIAIQSGENDISLTATSTNKDNGALAVYTDKNLNITAKNIKVSAVSSGENALGVKVANGGQAIVNGNLSIQAKHKGDGVAYGVYLYQDGNFLHVQGDLTMKGDGNGPFSYGVQSSEKGGYGSKEYRATGIYIYDNKKGSAVSVDGKSEIYVQGVGIDMRGSENNSVTLSHGTIMTPDDVNEASYKAIAATSGIFRMGMNEADTDTNEKDVMIRGKINVGDKGSVYLGLGSGQSNFIGVVDKDSKGVAKFYLKNKALWENRLTVLDSNGLFKGSHVSELIAGNKTETQGIIHQKDKENIMIDRYSGHMLVFYDHQTTASRDSTSGLEIIGGNIIIGKAETGSEITLRIDGKGLNMNSNRPADKNLINATLSNLAGKLFYTTHAEGNLKGNIEIAEGLTAATATKRVENINYKTDSGQGEYKYTQEEEKPLEPQDMIYQTGISGVYDKDKETFGTDVVTMPDPNKTGELNYDFTKQKSTTIQVERDSAAKNQSNGTLTIQANALNLIVGDGSVNGVSGLSVPDGGSVDITGNVNIKVVGNAWGTSGIGSSNAGSGISGKSIFNIHGNLTMRNDDEHNPWGIYNEGTIHGGYDNISYKGSRWAPVGIHLGTTYGSQFNVDGKVDLAVYGIAVATDPFYAAEGMNDYDLSVINLKGGRIETPKDKTEGYYALANFGGTINVNMNESKDGAADNDLTMVGNIISMKESIDENGAYSGGLYYYRDGRINLGLSTSKSSWTGVIDNTGKEQAGEVNVYLKNGASWIHEQVGKVNGLDGEHMPDPSKGHYGTYDGVSHVNYLSGGSKSEESGFIIQNYEKPITIDNYKGYTAIFYNHKTDEKDSVGKGWKMIGGDTKVTKAEAGSVITLLTGNEGLKTDSQEVADKNLVSGTLNALANKLWYMAYANGEKNLTGKVGIAEGLTTRSVSKTITVGDKKYNVPESNQLKDITWKDDGQGEYKYTEEQEKPPVPQEQTKTDFSTSITGGTDQEYVDAGVKKNDGTYKFTKDSVINIEKNNQHPIQTGANLIVNAAGKTLTLVNKGSALRVGIHEQTNKSVDITAGKLIIQAESTGGMNRAYGIWNNADVNVHGDTEINAKAGDWCYAVSSCGQAKTNLEGLKVSVNKDAKDSLALKATNGSVISVNVKNETVGVSQVQIDGDISTAKEDNDGTVTGPSIVNMALTTENSYWTGSSVYENKEKTESDEYGGDTTTKTTMGVVNVWLQNGATWTNTKYGKKAFEGWKGSYVTKLTGGTSADTTGFIYQNDEKPITIDNYKGYTTIFYNHKTDKPADVNTGYTMIGGDTKVTKAEAGSVIILLTGNEGLKTDSQEVAEKNLVSGTLNALANKLWYMAHKTDTNLTGKVGIAEGLTTRSVSKTITVGDKKYNVPESNQLKDIKWKENGQGQYEYTPEKGKPPTPPSPSEEDAIIHKTIKQSKTLTKDISVELKRSADDMDKRTAAIYNDHAAPINIDMNGFGMKLQIKSKSHESEIYGIYAEGGQVNVTSQPNKKPLEIDVSGKAATHGIYAVRGGIVDINNDVKITKVDSGKSTDGAYGIWAADFGSKVTIHGGYKIDQSVISETSRINHAYGAVASGQAEIQFQKPVSIDMNGTALWTVSDTSVIKAAGGVIKVGISMAPKKKYYAMNAEKGNIFFNMKNETEVDENTAQIRGNLLTTRKIKNTYSGGHIYLGLKGETSYWNGVVDAYPDADKNYKGQLDLYLQNGAIWRHTSIGTPWEKWTGSRVAKLTGGTSADTTGFIYQNDENPITIDNYKGYTTIFYNHKTDEKDSLGKGWKMIGGDTKVTKAEDGSVITLLTGNEGLKTDFQEVADKNLVSGTLNTLANKLWYMAYANGEKNLTGKVGVAEGLTSRSVTKTITVGGKKYNVPESNQLKDITWKDDGQGQYIETVEPGPQPGPQPPVSTASKNVYDLWKDYKDETGQQPNKDKEVKDFFKALQENKGQAVFDLWKNCKNEQGQQLNKDKKIEDFQKALMNEKGKDGVTVSGMWEKEEEKKGNAVRPGYFQDFLNGITHGPVETLMMNGGKNAMALAATMWLSNNNDLQRRMGDVRLTSSEHGLWARYMGGKNVWNPELTNIDQQYNVLQIGYDTKVSDWTIGGAFDYGTSNDTYTINDNKNNRFVTGSGKEKQYSLAVYGTKQFGNGEYADIIMKAARVNSKYTLTDPFNRSMTGDYYVNGVSVSGEYGKRMAVGEHSYIEPSIEFIAGRMRASDYVATSTFVGKNGKNLDMKVHMDEFSSLKGRLGLAAGYKTEKSNAFVKLSLNKEFCGDIKATFRSNEDEKEIPIALSLKDTWLDVEVGGSYLMNKDTYLYANLTKSFSAILKTEWRLDAGIRLAF